MHLLRWAALIATMLLAGCAGQAPLKTLPPGADGPEANPPPNLDLVPDAVPRIEPLRIGGPNKPYEALGQRFVPLTGDEPVAEKGLASWYGRKFHGRPTASGERYDMYAMTAAHKTMPIPSYARVRNPANGREIVVRVNDRGPFSPGRVIDLSYTAALKLGLLRGVAPVEVQRLTFDDIRAGNWRGAGVTATPRPAAVPLDDAAPGDPAPAGGWWLQLGAFRSRDGARGLQQRVLLEGGDLPGVAVVNDGPTQRVQAGPWPTREAALAAAERLRQALALAPVLVERRPAP